MITKQQVFGAALKYAQEQNPTANKSGIAPNDDFIAGAEWAAVTLEAENNFLIEENRYVEAENFRLFEQAAALQAENAMLRATLEETRQAAESYKKFWVEEVKKIANK